MAAMGSYIALVFVAAQFIGFFQYSKLGTIIAIGGADLLKSSGISGPLLIIAFILYGSGQPGDGILFSQMDHTRSGVRPAFYAHGIFPGTDTGGLPHRGFLYQCDHP